ncbi:protein PSK SIMULATOR 2-like [Bidens hawaiensis]|uniref:protein PSK SIMULATOR 2-like n=1 Tax=Bidens hawaiensis TaxID=980011 RepID=UPI00404B8490
MGGVCTGGTLKRHTGVDDVSARGSSLGYSGKLKSVKSFDNNNNNNQQQEKKKDDQDDRDDDLRLSSSSYTQQDDADDDDDGYHRKTTSFDSGFFSSISRELKPSTPARVKAPHVSTFLGKAGSVGLEVLDTLGSSMTSLNAHTGFVSNSALKGNKVTILAFEVANTIVKGSNLMQSLSGENIQILKKEILHSKGVQLLVSTDMKELLRIAASDKREEFEIFSKEVVRFGGMCKDPQWHNLDRFFARLDLDPVTNSQIREEAEIIMQELSNLAQHTSELYHEYHALDRFEQDYRRKLEEVESLNLPRKGENIMILQSELKHQRKLVRNLKKKSLWSKTREEVVEKLVDVVTFIHQAIAEAFEENGAISAKYDKESNKKGPERLGVAGLALHYANLISQMDNIASRPTSLPPNMRDTLYNGLPASVKAGLRSRLQALDSKESMVMPKIKAEMEKTLNWLVPVATDTTKAHQGFGWVGEWANTGNEFGKKTAGGNNIIRLQTLYHADKQKTDRYILDLVVLLHRLISCVRYRDKVTRFTPTRSPISKASLTLHPDGQRQPVNISVDDKNLLEQVTKRPTAVPGVSKSQEFVITKKKKRVFASSRSMGSSPRDLMYANANMLDVLDGLDTTF